MTIRSKTTEVATVADKAALERANANRELIQAAIKEMKQADFDGEQLVLDIMDSRTVEDILESAAIHLKDIIGVPFTINRVVLQDSSYEESVLPAYAVIFASFDDGTNAVITTGATTVVAQCVKMHKEGWYPQRVSSSAAVSSKGYDVIKLCKAPERVTPPEQF